jgi:DNA-binding beta-propeller fold protein YncE
MQACSTVHVIGYGFDDPKFSPGIASTYANVTVGGIPATVTQEILGSPISPYPFPIEYLTFTAPRGVGSAEIAITTPNGTATAKNAFHYFPHRVVSGVLPIQMLLDESRSKLYVSDSATGDIKSIDVNTLAVSTLLSGGALPGAGLAITPDRKNLLVNTPSGTLTVIDLDSGAVVNRLTPDFGTEVNVF